MADLGHEPSVDPPDRFDGAGEGVCACGHVYDEHDPADGLTCTVEGCACSYYDEDEAEALR